MLNIPTQSVILKPLDNDYIEKLLEWRNNDDFLKFCTNRKNKICLEDFKKELEKDFSFDRHLQYIILRKINKNPIGTIYSYNFNKTDGNVFVTTYIDKMFRRSIFGFEAFAVFVIWLFEKYSSLHKVYTDVYEYNLSSLLFLKKAGFIEEGRFKEHKLFNEKRWDMLRLAFYRTQLVQSKFAKRIKTNRIVPG